MLFAEAPEVKSEKPDPGGSAPAVQLPESAKELAERLDASSKAADFLRAELEQCRAQLKGGAEELAKSKKVRGGPKQLHADTILDKQLLMLRYYIR